MDDTSTDSEEETYPLEEEKTLEIISLIFLLGWGSHPLTNTTTKLQSNPFLGLHADTQTDG